MPLGEAGARSKYSWPGGEDLLVVVLGELYVIAPIVFFATNSVFPHGGE